MELVERHKERSGYSREVKKLGLLFEKARIFTVWLFGSILIRLDLRLISDTARNYSDRLERNRRIDCLGVKILLTLGMRNHLQRSKVARERCASC